MWALSQECKDSSISQINQCKTPINKLKNKNHMTISIGAEKVFDKFSIIYDKKKTPESRKISQHNKRYI